MSHPLLSVIIPAYNEERRLPATLRSCIQFLKQQDYDSELLVVTDGSTDRTELLARSFVSDFPQLTVLSFHDNRGKGFAVKEGMKRASGLYRLFMDADNAVRIEEVAGFLEMCQQGSDVVIAARTHPDSEIIQSQRFGRQLMGQLFGKLQQAVLWSPYKDTQCGFKLFTEKAAEALFPQVTFDCAYFDAELLYIAHRRGFKVNEHPVRWRHDGETRLPIGMKRTAELIRKLFSIRSIHSGL